MPILVGRKLHFVAKYWRKNSLFWQKNIAMIMERLLEESQMWVQRIWNNSEADLLNSSPEASAESVLGSCVMSKLLLKSAAGNSSLLIVLFFASL